MKIFITTIVLLTLSSSCKNTASDRSNKPAMRLEGCNPATDKNCDPNDGGFVKEGEGSQANSKKGGDEPDDKAENNPSTTGSKDTPVQATTGSTAGTTTGVTPNPTPSPTTPPMATKCTKETAQFVRADGPCHANWAAFAADDSKTYVLACCPLPSDDILLADAPIFRGGQCGSGEIAVGATAQAGLLCAKVNLTKYKLSPQTKTCYVGKGASGGSGVPKCKSPSELALGLVATFGSDACLPNPFGGLITKRTSKYCRDVGSVVLENKETGSPVPMF